MAVEAEKGSEKLADIFAKINMSELPAMSTNVRELISLTSSSRSSGYELAKVILKDYSLTNKVLQVVNSAYYSLGRPVNSISKAVTILGFDAVRDLATAIAIFEDFIKSGVEKEGISKLLTRSFLSGLQARDIAVEKHLNVKPEEAFICTLLRQLGKIIVCIYLPEIYREIENRMAAGASETVAARAVLDGLTLAEVGEEVAKFWNLSESVINCMALDPEKPTGSYDSDGYLHNLADFTTSLVDRVCDGGDLGQLLDKYGEMMAIDGKEAVEMLSRSVDVSEDVSDALRYGLSKLKLRNKIRVVAKNAELGILTPVKIPGKGGGAAKEEGKDEPRKGMPLGEESAVVELGELPISTDKSINDFIRDITETLMGPFDINDFYVNLLEGLYRGIGFDRVILAIISMQATKIALVGRYGLGDIDPVGVQSFEHQLANMEYAIPQALKNCKDMAILPNNLKVFPDNLHYLVKGRTVYLFPICVDSKGIGLIYLDRKQGRPQLDKSRIKAIRLFRDFAVMAIRKLQKKR